MKALVLVLLLLPLVVGAETITWTAPTTYTDGSAIDAATKATLGYYLRGYKEGNIAAKTYFGETRNGVTTWSDNILVRMNAWAVNPEGPVAGWVALKAGDNVLVTLSTAMKQPDGSETDGPESPPYRWTLPGAAPPPPPPPPKPSPSCNPPTGILIK
jgi:hypothetical protein